MFISAFVEKSNKSKLSAGRPVWDLLGALFFSFWAWHSLTNDMIIGRATSKLHFDKSPTLFTIIVVGMCIVSLIGFYQFARGYRCALKNQNT